MGDAARSSDPICSDPIWEASFCADVSMDLRVTPRGARIFAPRAPNLQPRATHRRARCAKFMCPKWDPGG
eukprot:5267484-Pyramimonas_sp.AAC.1